METKKQCYIQTPPMMIVELSRHFDEWMRLTRVEPLQGQQSCRILMRHLGHMEGCTQLDLVRASHLKPPTVSVTLKKLEENGFVSRKPDERDLRATRVSLTDKGRELNRSTYERCKMADKIMMQNVTQEEIEVLTSILEKMITSMRQSLETKRGDGNEAD